MGAGTGVVAQPDAEVLDLQRLPLLDLLHGHDLARGLLELPQLPQEVPEAGLGHDGVRSEDPHSEQKNIIQSAEILREKGNCIKYFF